MSIKERAKHEVAKMRQAATLTPNDGLLLMLMKIGSRPYVAWHSGVLMRALTSIEPLAKRLIPSSINGAYDEGCLFRICVDVYLAIVFLLLLFAYTIVVAIAQGAYSISGACAVSMILLLCVMRGYEIFAFLALLHSQPSYKSSSLIRSLVNTIWHYAEMMIIFGVCYLACNYFTGDRFAAESNATTIVSHYVNAAYFSFISLTTIGFGDLSPQSSIGKMLVMCEGITGLLLLVIVLQR